MDNYEIVDSFINRIILNFKYDDTIKNIIQKLRFMYDRDISATENEIKCKICNVDTMISIDKDNHTVKMFEEGKKKNKYFLNTTSYCAKGDMVTIIKQVVDYDIIISDNTDIITNERINTSYKYLENDKCMVSSSQRIKASTSISNSIVTRSNTDFYQKRFQIPSIPRARTLMPLWLEGRDRHSPRTGGKWAGIRPSA